MGEDDEELAGRPGRGAYPMLLMYCCGICRFARPGQHKDVTRSEIQNPPRGLLTDCEHLSLVCETLKCAEARFAKEEHVPAGVLQQVLSSLCCKQDVETGMPSVPAARSEDEDTEDAAAAAACPVTPLSKWASSGN
jgi:hypothetical protein